MNKKEEDKMIKVKVIFRKAKNPYTNEYEIIAFFPQSITSNGKIIFYMHIGQHCESNLEFYWDTKKAIENEYKELFDELKEIYNDCILEVRQKINYRYL